MIIQTKEDIKSITFRFTFKSRLRLSIMKMALSSAHDNAIVITLQYDTCLLKSM